VSKNCSWETYNLSSSVVSVAPMSRRPSGMPLRAAMDALLANDGGPSPSPTNSPLAAAAWSHRALGIEKHAHHEFTSSYTHEKASRATESATVASAIQDLREVRDQHRAGHEVLKPPGMIPRQAIGATSPSSGACPRCKKGRANSKFEFTCGRRVMICKGCAQSFVLILSQKIALLQALENQKSSDTDRGEEHTHTHTHIHAAQARHEPDALPATRVQALVAHLKDVDQAFEKSPKVCDMTHPRVT